MKIGEFEVKGDKLMVSDPCYERETWCQGIVKDVLPGRWVGEVEHSDEGSWGRRVCLLRAHHKSHANEPASEPTGFDIGVDSGQAGIFDESRYQLDGKGEYGEDGTWYGEACKCTHSPTHETDKHHPQAGILDLGGPLGIVSSSGYGDGSYDCLVGRNADGKVVAVEVVFIPEDDEDEDEEEDDLEEEVEEDEEDSDEVSG